MHSCSQDTDMSLYLKSKRLLWSDVQDPGHHSSVSACTSETTGSSLSLSLTCSKKKSDNKNHLFTGSKALEDS